MLIGEDGFCYMLYDDEDARHNHSLCYSDGVERAQIKRLIRLIKQSKPGVETAVVLESTSLDLDIKEGTLETLLVYLSLQGVLKLLPSGFAVATVNVVQTRSGQLETDLGFVTAKSIAKSANNGSDDVVFSFSLDAVAEQLR